MYTKHYKNERKRILSNSMSKAKGFYEAPNAGNNRKCLHSVALSPLSNIACSVPIVLECQRACTFLFTQKALETVCNL